MGLSGALRLRSCQIVIYEQYVNDRSRIYWLSSAGNTSEPFFASCHDFAEVHVKDRVIVAVFLIFSKVRCQTLVCIAVDVVPQCCVHAIHGI